jgi:uroporphyrinogen-III decarboxylase
MPTIDYEKHNAEVKAVWDAFHKNQPTRVPMVLGINPRFTMWDPAINPRGITFEQYMRDPQLMMERQVEHQHYIRQHVPQDAEMGMPKDGWNVYVDSQNCCEAAWLGCELHFSADQVPVTRPLLQREEDKNLLFERGMPDPFSGNWMKTNWKFYEHFLQKKKEGWTYCGLPIKDASPGGLGTDGPVTVACNLRGTTEFMTDLAADPEYAQKLLDFITTTAIARIKAFREKLGHPLKSKGWGYADDSLQLISTKMYEEMVLPFHKRLKAELTAAEQIDIHLCGDATRHFPFLRDHMGVKCFDTGFPVDFAKVRQAVGPKVQINGGPHIAFLLTATPDQVREESRRILQSGVMEGGRFVFREGNNLPPGVPLENVWAMYEACKEFGRYN